MFTWSEQTLNWFQDAAEYTGHYEKIAGHIRPYLNKEQQVCEIGCGPGYLSLAMAPDVKHVTAVDISPPAIARLEKLIAKSGTANITPHTGDWLHLPEEKPFDIIVLSYLSAVIRNWQQLQALCHKYIIAILANGKSGTQLKCRHYAQDLTAPGRETALNVSAFLREKGIPYELISAELEFGQPLRDLDDAIAFIKQYYKLHTREELQAYLKTHLQPLDQGWYLPKRKKSGILIIDVEAYRKKTSRIAGQLPQSHLKPSCPEHPVMR